MKMAYLLILAVLVTVVCGTFTNTTTFWSEKLGYTAADMHFQGYAGTFWLRFRL